MTIMRLMADSVVDREEERLTIAITGALGPYWRPCDLAGRLHCFMPRMGGLREFSLDGKHLCFMATRQDMIRCLTSDLGLPPL